MVPTRFLLALLQAMTLLALCATPVAASEPDRTLDTKFEPIAFLVGHCWRATFPDGKQQDVQCYRALYGGKLVESTHRVEGSDPLYRGKSLFSWDEANKRLRFHYFTSTGAMSEGYFARQDEGYVIPERHAEADGTQTELETRYERDGDTGYRVVSRQRKAGGAWKAFLDLRYVRIDERPVAD